MKKALALLGALCLVAALGFAVNAELQRRQLDRQLEAAQGQIATLEESLSQVEASCSALEEQLAKSQKEVTAATRRDNPIDRYYYAPARLERSTGTILEGIGEAGFYKNVWRLEFLHALEWVKETVGDQYSEDRELLERCRELVEEQAEVSWDLSKLRGAAMGFSPEERNRDFYALFGRLYTEITLFTQAEVYRQGTFWLLDTYNYVEPWNKHYEFNFNDTVRVDIAEENNPLFPPIADVVQDG